MSTKFKLGDRVMLSDVYISESPDGNDKRRRDVNRVGTVVGMSRGGSPHVRWDGNKPSVRTAFAPFFLKLAKAQAR